jgi:hypothetical protein
MLVARWVIWGGSQGNSAAAKSLGAVERVGLFGLTPRVGFKFPIETALQVINPVEIPEPAGIQDGVVMRLKQTLIEKLPNRKLEQLTHDSLWGLENGRKAQIL